MASAAAWWYARQLLMPPSVTRPLAPLELLVLPKLLALVLVLPLLTVFADVLGVAGGMVMARVQLGVSYGEFLDRFAKAISPTRSPPSCEIKSCAANFARVSRFGVRSVASMLFETSIAISTSRPCTTRSTLAPIGSSTLVCT